MPSLPFLTLDVFTATRFIGNPLAIVRIPPHHAPPLTQEQKQRIAREFNLSKTIFLHESSDDAPVGEEIVRVDIFTTGQELPFAAHSTIGAGTRLQTLAGQMQVTSFCIADPDYEDVVPAVAINVPLDVYLHRTRVPIETEMAPLFPSIKPEDYMDGNGIPVLAALARVTPCSRRIKAPQEAPWDKWFIGVYFYMLTSMASAEDRVEWRVRTRMIDMLLEDPAGGSAASALSAYLAKTYESKEGVEMGKRSTIGTQVVVKEGAMREKVVERVQLRGTAVKVMEGLVEY
ncbi:hypothetical protein BDZ91DRAFT_777107 [Kalaharituber pfeilii]|nr:hypothetical protein BDZ91DRAFT_777107 [Kalaharituber pfeilii]